MALGQTLTSVLLVYLTVISIFLTYANLVP